MDPKHGGRSLRPGEISRTAIIVAVMVAATSVAVMTRLVHDMLTFAALFSIYALPVMLLIYYIARRFSQRSRSARESALLERDERDRAHMAYMIRTCRQLALGLVASSKAQPGPAAPAVSHIAEMAGSMMSRHGHLVNKDGKRS